MLPTELESNPKLCSTYPPYKKLIEVSAEDMIPYIFKENVRKRLLKELQEGKEIHPDYRNIIESYRESSERFLRGEKLQGVLFPDDAVDCNLSFKAGFPFGVVSYDSGTPFVPYTTVRPYKFKERSYDGLVFSLPDELAYSLLTDPLNDFLDKLGAFCESIEGVEAPADFNLLNRPFSDNSYTNTFGEPVRRVDSLDVFSAFLHILLLRYMFVEGFKEHISFFREGEDFERYSTNILTNGFIPFLNNALFNFNVQINQYILDTQFTGFLEPVILGYKDHLLLLNDFFDSV